MKFEPDYSVDSLSDYVAHWSATGELPPALVTGDRLIDSEHRFLIDAIGSLRKICVDLHGYKDCTRCSKGQNAHCEGELIRLLGDIFAFILDHFKTEEAIMRDSLMVMVERDICHAHMEDHANISATVQEIVSTMDAQNIVGRLRELDVLLARWVNNHIQMHDILVSRWIARDDSLIKFG